MADKIFRGDAIDVAQVDEFVVGGTIEIGDLFIATINGKAISTPATTTVAATTASEAQADIEANTNGIPEFEEIESEVNSATITLTAATPGVPFTIVASTTESNGGAADDQTYSDTTVVANSGHWNWDDASNWNASGVPANSDVVYIGETDVAIKYGLAQSAVTLTALNIAQAYIGEIGLPVINEDGDSPYQEYRATYLAIGATTINIGEGAGNGSGRIKLNTGSVQTSVNVFNSGNPLEAGLEAILWKGTHASNVVEVVRGSFGAAVLPGETATIATLRVGFVEDQDSGAQVRCGTGVTLTTVEQSGGVLTTASSITTKTQSGGTHYVLAGNITTLNLNGGRMFYRGAGTLTTVKVGSNAELDFSQDLSPRTITNAVLMYKGAKLRDPHATVTFSGGITLVGCRYEDVEIDIGVGKTLTIS